MRVPTLKNVKYSTPLLGKANRSKVQTKGTRHVSDFTVPYLFL